MNTNNAVDWADDAQNRIEDEIGPRPRDCAECGDADAISNHDHCAACIAAGTED